MSHRNAAFAASSRTYRPWGHVRRRNLAGRALYSAAMLVLGLTVLAALVLLVVFAASVAVAAGIALALAGLYAALTRRPVQVRVHVRDADRQASGKGLYIARKSESRSGSTWTVY